jgi:hypothetical protein
MPGATSTFISSGNPKSAVSRPATELTTWRIGVSHLGAFTTSHPAPAASPGSPGS